MIDLAKEQLIEASATPIPTESVSEESKLAHSTNVESEEKTEAEASEVGIEPVEI